MTGGRVEGAAVAMGAAVVPVGRGEKVKSGYDGMGVAVGTADKEGRSVGTAGTGASVGP